MRLIFYLIRLLWWPQWALEGPGEWATTTSPTTDADVTARAITAAPRVGGTRMDGHCLEYMTK